MIDLMSAEEFEKFERRWKVVFTCFALIFAGALLDYLLRSPFGIEAFWCYSVGAFAFAVCVWAARKLGDEERYEGAMGGPELSGEDLPSFDFDD